VLKTLAAGGLVVSQRGAHGGYRLMRKLAAIPVADVIAAIDGPIALTACVDGTTGSCESEGLCPMRGRWDPVNEAIQQALSAITLADMQQASIPRAFRLPFTRPGLTQAELTQGELTRSGSGPAPVAAE
jgi:DNA-binding IscR family transcriptional regulator